MKTHVLAIAFAAAVVFGQVRDLTTGQPLPSVTVSIGSHHTVSDAHGRYRLTGIPVGTQDITAQSDDVPLHRESVTVGSSQTKVDLQVCSTTLDYGCANGGGG
jgi:hypothetical protein